MAFTKGQRVRHATKPEWGLGQVLENSSSSSVRVFFVGEGEKELSLTHVALLPVDGPEAAHPVLDNLRLNKEPGARYVTLAAAVERFLELYPQGFYGEKYLEQERNYKVKAHTLATQMLAQNDLEALLEAAQFDEVCKRALKVVSATNLIFPNEKMALSDGLDDPGAKKAFSTSLHQLLHSPLPYQHRFEQFAQVLREIGAAKWTTATYFPFLVLPDEHMFIKPTVTQKAAELSAFELNYRPDVNWLTYKCVLDFSAYLRKELAPLKPRDMIDVQSFMWCIAPEI